MEEHWIGRHSVEFDRFPYTPKDEKVFEVFVEIFYLIIIENERPGEGRKWSR